MAEKHTIQFTSEKLAKKAIEKAEAAGVSTDEIKTLLPNVTEVTFYCSQDQIKKFTR